MKICVIISNCELMNVIKVFYMWHKMADSYLPVFGIMGNISPRGEHYGCFIRVHDELLHDSNYATRADLSLSDSE